MPIHAIPANDLQRARRVGRLLGRAHSWPLRRLGMALVLLSNSAFAERDPAECIAAHAKAQELVDAGKLKEAREKFDSCATSDCPKVIQRDCKVLGRAVESATPALNLTVLDHHGRALLDYGIEVDGVVLPADAAHRPVALDPGNRRLRITTIGRKALEVTIPLRSQDKFQRAVVQLAAPEPTPSKARTAGYVLAGVGASGLLTFSVFGVLGYQDQRKLEKNAAQANVGNDYGLADSMHRKYLIADVSLAIGLVSLGAATYLLLFNRDTTEQASPGPKTALALQGTPGGGGLVLRGEF